MMKILTGNHLESGIFYQRLHSGVWRICLLIVQNALFMVNQRCQPSSCRHVGDFFREAKAEYKKTWWMPGIIFQ